MKELSLPEMKEIELEILKVFHAFCAENNIRYFLAYGTLLGAIRYKGFIPWDDDIDVLVPREDYDRLVTLFQDSERYRLFAFEKDPAYGYPFAKLCDMTTRIEETVYSRQSIPLGLQVDIFPLDAWDPDPEKAKKEARRIKKHMTWLGYTKVDKPLTDNPLKFFVWSIILLFAKLRGTGYYVRKIIRESRRPQQKDSRYVGAKAWSIYGERGIIPAEAFAETIEIPFEDAMFPAPKDYDTYLTCLYGDYLPEPPAEKRKTHHFFKAYRL